MSEPVSENMICPKCGQFQPRAETCSACGVIVAKLRPQTAAAATGAAPGQSVPVQSAASPEAPAPAAPVSPEGAGEPSRELPLAGKIAVLGFFLVIMLLGLVAVIPKNMTISEFVEAKESSFHFRDFRIEGVVEPYRSVVEVTLGDKRLSSLKISANGTTSYLYFDSDEISPAPKKGNRVRARGNFENIPFYRMPGKLERITVAVATSIEILN